jgi:ubiquinone/menaquinone biosynthesis C-methylase UbiE
MKNPAKEVQYGSLMAKWYDRILESETNDIEFYKSIAAASDGRVLEIACGTGRLLVPIRELGVDIEGLDISPDMLAVCREKLLSKNLTSQLYEHDMVDLDTGELYRIIFISGGTLQLIEDIGKAMAALKKMHAHLQPGGELVMDIFCPWEQIKQNQEGQWKVRRTARHQDEELWCYECSYFDLREQIQRMRTKYELYKDNRLLGTSCGEMNLRWYGKHEFKLMLEKAGFSRVRMEAVTIISRDGEGLVYYADKD